MKYKIYLIDFVCKGLKYVHSKEIVHGDLKCEIEFVNNEEYGKEYINGRLEFERKFKDWYKWDGKGYDENGNIIYELFNGNSKVK